MSDKVSDERVREYAASFNNPDVRALATELLALRAQQQAAGSRVRPLEWGEPYSDPSGYVSYDARSIVGGFAVYRVKADLQWIAERSGMGRRIGAFDTEAEAKAAAQSDYAARINSAIEPAAAMLPTEAQVRQAFLDGISYATMVEVTDPELAWQQSRARTAMLAARPISASGRDGE